MSCHQCRGGHRPFAGGLGYGPSQFAGPWRSTPDTLRRRGGEDCSGIYRNAVLKTCAPSCAMVGFSISISAGSNLPSARRGNWPATSGRLWDIVWTTRNPPSPSCSPTKIETHAQVGPSRSGGLPPPPMKNPFDEHNSALAAIALAPHPHHHYRNPPPLQVHSRPHDR